MRTKKSFLVVLFLAAFALYCTNTVKELDYYDPEVLATHFNGEAFVGSETCRECHAEVYAHHLETAHYHTSAIANKENIHGSFRSGENTLVLGDVKFEMEREGDDFYQLTKDKNGALLSPAEKIDVVIGSGVKGQSYLTWEEEHLSQLQVSYFPPTDSWINSPGYPPQFQRMKRPVRDGCLKCHVTFATNRDFSGQGNEYDKGKMIYGIDCERCHRPGAKHVVYHRENPDAKEAKFMLKLDTLSRQLRLDVCAQCHSGLRSAVIQGNAFSYLSGEPLKEYSRNYYSGLTDSELDVHGNQYGLLTSSKCFQSATTMDCGTCHDPHKQQRGDTEVFNQKCMGCHTAGNVSCTATAAEMHAMDDNCIACHMPNTPSKTMSVQLKSDRPETSIFVRNHLIGIYPKESWRN